MRKRALSIARAVGFAGAAIVSFLLVSLFGGPQAGAAEYTARGWATANGATWHQPAVGAAADIALGGDVERVGDHVVVAVWTAEGMTEAEAVMALGPAPSASSIVAAAAVEVDGAVRVAAMSLRYVPLVPILEEPTVTVPPTTSPVVTTPPTTSPVVTAPPTTSPVVTAPVPTTSPVVTAPPTVVPADSVPMAVVEATSTSSTESTTTTAATAVADDDRRDDLVLPQSVDDGQPASAAMVQQGVSSISLVVLLVSVAVVAGALGRYSYRRS